MPTSAGIHYPFTEGADYVSAGEGSHNYVCDQHVFFFVFGFFAYLRYLKHKESMTLAEKGLLPQEAVAPNSNLDNGMVRWAVILIMVGAALCVGLYPIGWLAMPGELPLNFGPWMLVGILPMFFGIGLLVIHFLPTLQVLLRQELGAAAKPPSQPAQPEQADAPAADDAPAAVAREDQRADSA